ncbi:DNA replication/repair protein RecF [Paramagnetospirillum magnetotacticum]|uniref:DNA replication/repair protein RecF n=1 Tax=Paramagnetospirillum magnetotacticum TaxID=188 RepID=UPI000596E886|nr:DNA replication/repair protein RecF [Paramagnetospirillum magnetotacticum]
MTSADLASRPAVRRLSLADFRCYGTLRLETDARPVVLTGPNGAGKTNILEALSFLVPGRGLRRAGAGDITRHGLPAGSPWAVAASLDGPAGRVEIGTGREAGHERRSVRIDGKPAKPGDLAGLVSALWLTPAMDRLFIEGASGRRRFLDRLVFGLVPGHGAQSGAYEHAMRERTRLLRAARDGGPKADPGWIAALEEGMARHGTKVAVARVESIQRLDTACRAGMGPFPAAGLAVEGEIEGWLAGGTSPEEAEDRFKSALRLARARDEAAGAATMGPHRSDLSVRHVPKDLPAGLCSTGEQKAVLVSIVLAQGRVQNQTGGRAPLLLLDEVAAHLDEVRRAALFDELCALRVQSWMTGTDAMLFAGFGERAQFFRVTDATVAPDKVET